MSTSIRQRSRQAARKASRLRKQAEGAVRFLTWHLGWIGLLLLLCCGVLWLLPGSRWDGTLALRARDLPLYTLSALILASLLGWNCVNRGEDRIKQRLGRGTNLLLFVAVPVACVIATLAQDRVVSASGWQAPDHPFWQFVRWYSPVLVMVSAAVFMAWKSRPRKHVYLERGAGYALLLGPYALLFAYLALGVHLDWLEGPMQRTVADLGGYALALQLVLAYFVGSD